MLLMNANPIHCRAQLWCCRQALIATEMYNMFSQLIIPVAPRDTLCGTTEYTSINYQILQQMAYPRTARISIHRDMMAARLRRRTFESFELYSRVDLESTYNLTVLTYSTDSREST
eukprot:GILK01015471.1.p1 GENE.GILK01015471.1~~GILK01015471.1.p1  ORF type:complete len:116 (-),score=0.73 GILK01015471.1:87-434(-)